MSARRRDAADSTRRPRVLVVARMSPRLNTRTRTVVETLQDSCDVTVLCEAPNMPRSGSPLFQRARLCEIQLVFPGKRVWHLTGMARVVQLNWYGIKHVFHDRPDVVVCSDVPYAFAGLFAKVARGGKFVFNAHEIIWGMAISPTMARLFKWLERYVLKACDVWLVPSQERAELMLREHRILRGYVVMENFPMGYRQAVDRVGARADLRKAGVPDDRFVVMFQGSLAAKRGLEPLVEAARMGRFHLVVQGSGALKTQLQSTCHEYLTVLDACPNHETMQWLSGADASFVYYENDCLNSAYACSNKFYASIFAGTPVLCNRLPAFETFADQYGGVVFFDHLDPASLNARISAIKDDAAEYERIRGQVLAARSQLASGSREERLQAAIRELIKGCSRG